MQTPPRLPETIARLLLPVETSAHGQVLNASPSSSSQHYFPQSRARARILLLLLEHSPRSLREITEEVADTSCNYTCVKKALSYLWQRGILKRVSRGLYSISEPYMHILISFKDILEQYAYYSSTPQNSKKGDTNVKKVTPLSPSVTFLKEERLGEKIREYVKQRYGKEIGETELLVIETLVRKYEETGSWYIVDNEGVGLAEQLQGWMERLGLCKEGSSSNSSSYTRCPSLIDVEKALVKLADLGIVFVMPRYRKMRLSKHIVERALRSA